MSERWYSSVADIVSNFWNEARKICKGRFTMKSKVYFTREITPENVVALYRALGVELPGKVAVKVHSGVKSNQNILHPEF